jgi:hypothetical protein
VLGVDMKTGRKASVVLEALWGKKVSIYDEQDVFMSSGNATITVETISADATRIGTNKIKLLGVVAYSNL